jgi:uncharacterized protein with HEPN domain
MSAVETSRIRAFLQHAVEAIHRVAEYTAGLDEAGFPGIPWKDVYAMRNRVSHGYFSVDLEVVWQAIQRDIPALGEQLLRLLDGLESGPGK